MHNFIKVVSFENRVDPDHSKTVLIQISLFITSVAYIQKIHSGMFSIRRKHYKPRSECFYWSSLNWVQIVCNIGHQSVNLDERATTNVV